MAAAPLSIGVLAFLKAEANVSPLHDDLWRQDMSWCSRREAIDGMQGATDIDVVASSPSPAPDRSPAADVLALVAGDSDFRPALLSCAGQRHGSRVWGAGMKKVAEAAEAAEGRGGGGPRRA